MSVIDFERVLAEKRRHQYQVYERTLKREYRWYTVRVSATPRMKLEAFAQWSPKIAEEELEVGALMPGGLDVVNGYPLDEQDAVARADAILDELARIPDPQPEERELGYCSQP